MSYIRKKFDLLIKRLINIIFFLSFSVSLIKLCLSTSHPYLLFFQLNTLREISNI